MNWQREGSTILWVGEATLGAWVGQLSDVTYSVVQSHHVALVRRYRVTGLQAA